MDCLTLRKFIRDIPDFPKKGIMFKDITPLLRDGEAFRMAVDALASRIEEKEVDLLVGIESRGFLFGSAIAYKMGLGIVPVRKTGKLPAETERISYSLEYGEAVLEIHKDAFEPGTRVAVIDDLLATGGTAVATAELVEKLGGNVATVAFLVELEFLKGREKLSSYDVTSLIQY